MVEIKTTFNKLSIKCTKSKTNSKRKQQVILVQNGLNQSNHIGLYSCADTIYNGKHVSIIYHIEGTRCDIYACNEYFKPMQTKV